MAKCALAVLKQPYIGNNRDTSTLCRPTIFIDHKVQLVNCEYVAACRADNHLSRSRFLDLNRSYCLAFVAQKRSSRLNLTCHRDSAQCVNQHMLNASPAIDVGNNTASLTLPAVSIHQQNCLTMVVLELTSPGSAEPRHKNYRNLNNKTYHPPASPFKRSKLTGNDGAATDEQSNETMEHDTSSA